LTCDQIGDSVRRGEARLCFSRFAVLAGRAQSTVSRRSPDYRSAGMRNAPGIRLSRVARIAPFASASCLRWPSVVSFAVLTQPGRFEMSWSSVINVKFTVGVVFSRRKSSQAWETVIPYCGACARTRTKPSSVIEQVASSELPALATARTHRATRWWNSCSRKPTATKAFTSSRCVMGILPESHALACCLTEVSRLLRLEPEVL